MKDMVKNEGCSADFEITSAAISREEIGNPVYLPARQKLTEHKISYEGHVARQLTSSDYDDYHLPVGMDALTSAI